MPRTRIAIVGGGCAGLGAATALLRYDVELLLIEASARLGGRAQTSSNPAGLPVDMGPQFIQDSQDNPWKPIMDSLGIQGIAPTIDTVYRILDGEVWSDRTTPTPGIAAINEAIDEGFAAAASIPNAPPVTVLPPNLAAQDKSLALGSNGYGSVAESAEPWNYIASDSARQIGGNGPNIYVQGGIGNLVEDYGRRLTTRHAGRLMVLLSTPIARIASNDRAVTVTANDGRPAVVDYCIVTTPVGQLDNGTLAFDPPLDAGRRTALGLVQLGAYKKVAFRPTTIPAAIAVGNEYYISDAVSGGCWQYFLLPTDPTILICVASGDFARQLDGALPDLVREAIGNLLAQSYPAGDFRPRDGKVVVTNWSHAPFVQGAYSYTRYDARMAADDPTAFQARIAIAKPHHRIHFAGEATWAQGYGTIAGAYRSGERAADEIVARIGIPLA